MVPCVINFQYQIAKRGSIKLLTSSIWSISPGTTSEASTSERRPSRRTTAFKARVFFSSSTIEPAWNSWMKPTDALSRSKAQITPKSTQSLRPAASTAAAYQKGCQRCYIPRNDHILYPARQAGNVAWWRQTRRRGLYNKVRGMQTEKEEVTKHTSMTNWMGPTKYPRNLRNKFSFASFI